MNEAELSRYIPEYGAKSKKERDALLEEYMDCLFSNQKRKSAEWQQMEELEEKLAFKDLVNQIPRLIDTGDSLTIVRKVLDVWKRDEGIEDGENTDEFEALKKTGNCLQLWETAGVAILNGLDTRDQMMALAFVMLLTPTAVTVGKAARALQKSIKFPAFMTFALEDGLAPDNDNILHVVPMKYESLRLLHATLWTPSSAMIKRLRKAKTIDALVTTYSDGCPLLLRYITQIFELFLLAADKDITLKELLRPYFTRIAKISCKQVLKTDMKRGSFMPHVGPKVGAVDIGDVVGAYANILISIASEFKIPIPMKVRKHLSIFGQGYTACEPTDPLERKRWSHRYFAMRAYELDWASDEALPAIANMKWARSVPFDKAEENRKLKESCLRCGKIETEINKQLKKCARCKIAIYCSKDCQVSDWKKHKAVCRKISKIQLPQRVLSLEEVFDNSYDKSVAGGREILPYMFAIWLDRKFSNSDQNENLMQNEN